MQKLEAQKTEATDQYASYEAQIHQLRTQLVTSETLNEQLRAEIQLSIARLQEEEVDAHQLAEDLQAARDELDKQQREISDAEEKLVTVTVLSKFDDTAPSTGSQVVSKSSSLLLALKQRAERPYSSSSVSSHINSQAVPAQASLGVPGQQHDADAIANANANANGNANGNANALQSQSQTQLLQSQQDRGSEQLSVAGVAGAAVPLAEADSRLARTISSLQQQIQQSRETHERTTQQLIRTTLTLHETEAKLQQLNETTETRRRTLVSFQQGEDVPIHDLPDEQLFLINRIRDLRDVVSRLTNELEKAKVRICQEATESRCEVNHA